MATGKLFCACRTDADPPDDEHPDARFVRRLRPTQSELGEVDAAALLESQRDRSYEYRGWRASNCLVEADEEPPHPANEAALDAAVMAALLFEAHPVDEVQWMRKIVIDGSNTSGFQRTSLVATGGRVEDTGLQTLCLEEDSARRIRDEEDRVVWGLDRLGIPLIEIATEPTLRNGAHARAVAARIGALLRSTGRVKRGLGTIRQDLNVSIRDGTRVEVKGVQELNAIPHVIGWEVHRQLRLVEVSRVLRERGATPESLAWNPVNVTDRFRRTQAKFLRKIVQDGGLVLGHRLPGFHGLLGAARPEDPRLGKELAAYVRRDAGLRGILHGDELPGLGITEAEVSAVRKSLSCGPQDSFVLVAAEAAKAERGLRVAVARAARALQGVPPEVRGAEPDHSTTYLRPMPGAARMYPETDIPPMRLTAERCERLRANLPPPPEVQAGALRERHGISDEEARQIVGEGLVAEFEALAAAGDGPPASRVLLSYLPDLERRFPASAARLMEWSRDALAAVKAGRFAKEGLSIVLESLASGESGDVEAAIRARGLAGADASEVEQRARELVQERIEFVRQRGVESIGPLMGLLMKEFRGRVDGQDLNRVLAREVRRALENPAQRA